jgi:hypothetical protein
MEENLVTHSPAVDVARLFTNLSCRGDLGQWALLK